MSLDLLMPLCDAMVHLFDPFVEVVVHDLLSNTIAYKTGRLSPREKGESSLIAIDDIEADLGQVVYPKLGFDGRLVKSVSVKISEQWLVCINCDVSIFSTLKAVSDQFLKTSILTPPKSLFKNDWQERLHRVIHDYIKEQGLAFSSLNQREKKELVKHLYEQGAFAEKNAADYVSRAMSLGRATVFNYLRELRAS